MSKKSKLILATAVFGAALFGASCGGGGGGGTASAPPPPPPPPPPPGVDGQVLALLTTGSASAGTLKPVTICQLKSDNKAYCGSDLNPSENLDLNYLHELDNGNVVLRDPTSNVLYFFNGSQVIRPTSYRFLGATSDTPAPGGITALTGTSVKWYATSNLGIMVDNSGTTRNLVVITSSGKVIKDSGSSDYTVYTSCEVVAKGTTSYYKLNADGTSSNITTTIPDEVLDRAGDRVLVRKNTKVYLSSSECSTSGALEVVNASTTPDDARMVKVGNDFYIAVRAGTNLYYRKVSGSAIPVSVNITLASSPNKYHYALDGKGRLYAITDDNTVTVYNIDGTLLGTAPVTDVAGLLGLADRALAKGSASTPNAHEITITGSAVNAVNKGTTLYDTVDKCTDGSNTKSVDGAGTNFIRCAHNSGLYSLTFDSGLGLYSKASHSVTINDVKWATNKVLVKLSSSSIKLCSTTTTPSISCSDTDLPDFDITLLKEGSTDKYLKVNGNNVFYYIGSTAPYTLKVGDIFGTISALPITVSNPSGGNASLDLNKFAFSFTPAGATCATQIAYLSSRTASLKTYTLAQPGTCVTRILKVY
jgi:hypothetical protein